MHLFLAIVALCFATTLEAAPRTQISVSLDGRYVVVAHLIKRSDPPPTNERPDPSRAMGKDQIYGLDLFDRKTGKTDGLEGGDGAGRPPATRLPEFKAIWSPDSRYVAISGPFSEMVVVHNMGPGADSVGRMRIDPRSISTVSLFRVGKVLPVDLPPYQVFATSRGSVVQRGEVVDHWEGNTTLWTADRREGQLYRYHIRRKFFW